MDTITNENINFNSKYPTLMHVDLNSCFATIEQQANPKLRGKPVAVCAYTTGSGCILAASYEAKAKGVGTGMRVRDGQSLCPDLVIMPSDPEKYRFVNRKLLGLFEKYVAKVEVKSIDEMVMDFAKSPLLTNKLKLLPFTNLTTRIAMLEIGQEIKRRIKEDIGEWLTVSVGISTNRYLAKIAAGLHKPDGLDIIYKENIEEILKGMKLEDLTGIKEGYGNRLRSHGIINPISFYNASIKKLKTSFHSIIGHHWWMRLHGFEIDDREFSKKSVGHSYALYEPYMTCDSRLYQIVCQLTEKMGNRLRRYGMRARGIHIYCLLGDYNSWHHGESLNTPIYADSDLYKQSMRILSMCPKNLVRNIAINCFSLTEDLYLQMALYDDENKKENRTKALDLLHKRWGRSVVTSARMLNVSQQIKDRISFGGVKDLESFIFKEKIDMDISFSD